MPLTPAQRQQLPSHLKHFTDRDSQLAAFEALWRDSIPILAFDGVSGSGKSTLLRVLITAYAMPQNIPHALLDFDDPHGSMLRQSAIALCDALVLSHTLALPSPAKRRFQKERDRAQERLARRKAEIRVEQTITAQGGAIVRESDQTLQLNLAALLEQWEEEARLVDCSICHK